MYIGAYVVWDLASVTSIVHCNSGFLHDGIDNCEFRQWGLKYPVLWWDTLLCTRVPVDIRAGIHERCSDDGRDGQLPRGP